MLSLYRSITSSEHYSNYCLMVPKLMGDGLECELPMTVLPFFFAEAA